MSEHTMDIDTSARVRQVVADLFLGGDRSVPLDENMNLVEVGICDSLGLLQLAEALEPAFPGLVLRDEDISAQAMGTVRSITDLVAARGGA